MVRLETIKQDTVPPETYEFTFQYGQIRNKQSTTRRL